MKLKAPSLAASLGLALLALLNAPIPMAHAQGTAFTYQGRLTDGADPANGIYDLRFVIYSASTGSGVVAGPLNHPGILVSNGLFTVTVDPGAGVFTGAERWLQLEARTNGAGAFTALTPRQKITAAPHAVTAANVTGPVPGSQLTGTVPNVSLPSGGNWALSAPLTLGPSTLTIDPLNHRVGIGTANPLAPLHLSASQGAVRLDSTTSFLGSVLDLRNNAIFPTYLGAINFNNASGSTPGQIAYLRTNVMVFQVAGTNRMSLDGNGRLDVIGDSSEVTLNNRWSASGGLYGYNALRASCDTMLGSAILATSDFGTAIQASSTDGWAGVFSGAVQINYASPFDKPQLRLRDPANDGWARLRLQTGTKPLWDLAVGGTDNSLRFYADGNGDVVSVKTNGQMLVKVLTITGGADIAEPFEMSETDLPPGAVVVIDELNPGKLKLSTAPFDRRVAGVISGAGGVRPGLSLQQNGVMEGNQHVALTGRVYVQADTSNGPILPGDLLTTSHEAGHAMKVTDPARAQGAILGKAMTGLAAGRGLVLVLVTLQ
jgi:hypothetical protein